MGVQGAGKGTQVTLLKDYLAQRDARATFSFETGNGFRELMQGTSYTARLVRASMARGELQPVFLSVWLWARALVHEFTGEEHMLIDGFPRSVFEAQVLHTAFDFYRRFPVMVLFLDVPDEEALRRLIARGRHDDVPEAITRRLAWYRESVLPILEWYDLRDEYELVRIDGTPQIEEVHRAVVAAIEHQRGN